MPLWLLIFILAALIKIPLAGFMLWWPFRNDGIFGGSPEAPDSSEEDGGSKALPGGPLDPHPRRPLPHFPRRGPHGTPSPCPPPRVRTRVAVRRPVHSHS